MLPVFHKTAARQTIPAPKAKCERRYASSCPYSFSMAGVPGRTIAASSSTSQLVSRMQPCEVGVADLARLRGTVNPVMIFGEVDPCQPDRIVRTRGERLLVG